MNPKITKRPSPSKNLYTYIYICVCLCNTQLQAEEEEEAIGSVFFTQATELSTGLSYINGTFVPTHQLSQQTNETNVSNFDLNDPVAAQNALAAFASMNPTDPGYNSLLTRLNEAVDLETIGREDIDDANLPNHDLYMGNIVELDPAGVPTRENIIDYLLWVANQWSESAWGESMPHENVTNLEEFAENLLAGSHYLEEASPLEALGNFVASYGANSDDLLDLLLDGDHSNTYIGGWANEDAPLIGEILSGAISSSPEKLAALSKGLKGPNRDMIWALYSGDHDVNYERDIVRKIDWQGVNTDGLEFYYKDLSNSNISGSQLNAASSVEGIEANGVNLSGFNPASKSIVDASFKNATNVNVGDIVKSSNFSNTSFQGATKPDGSLLTRADFEAAISSQFPEDGSKMTQLNSVTF
jgi:uncharacterized protein YjbI with pentapeptide repeats